MRFAFAALALMIASPAIADEDCLKLSDPVLYRNCLERRNNEYVKSYSDDDKSVMKAASVVVGLSMRVDGKIVVDSDNRAHLDGTDVTFQRNGVCTFTGSMETLGGSRFLRVSFDRLTLGYGYYRNELVVSGGEGERQATCFQNDSSGVRCSGSLHVLRPVDENLLISNMRYVQSHGCDATVRRGY